MGGKQNLPRTSGPIDAREHQQQEQTAGGPRKEETKKDYEFFLLSPAGFIRFLRESVGSFREIGLALLNNGGAARVECRCFEILTRGSGYMLPAPEERKISMTLVSCLYVNPIIYF